MAKKKHFEHILATGTFFGSFWWSKKHLFAIAKRLRITSEQLMNLMVEGWLTSDGSFDEKTFEPWPRSFSTVLSLQIVFKLSESSQFFGWFLVCTFAVKKNMDSFKSSPNEVNTLNIHPTVSSSLTIDLVRKIPGLWKQVWSMQQNVWIFQTTATSVFVFSERTWWHLAPFKPSWRCS